jgi:hypothetical protein
MTAVKGQLRRHSVALVSLFVALSSLAYNTWRNEKTEMNRNVRTAGVEMLLQLGELDRIVFFSHYEQDAVRGSPRSGWAHVLTIRDLGGLTAPPATESSQAVARVWQSNWSGLGGDDAAATAISDSIDRAREDVLEVLASLE